MRFKLHPSLGLAWSLCVSLGLAACQSKDMIENPNPELLGSKQMSEDTPLVDLRTGTRIVLQQDMTFREYEVFTAYLSGMPISEALCRFEFIEPTLMKRGEVLTVQGTSSTPPVEEVGTRASATVELTADNGKALRIVCFSRTPFEDAKSITVDNLIGTTGGQVLVVKPRLP